MTDFTPEIDQFVVELDAAVEAHMDWTRRVLRCTVLRVTPGDDVMAPEAHTLCRFGDWFRIQRKYFEALDALSTQRIETVHHSMHDAIRGICANVLAGQPGRMADLQAFELAQDELLALLARFKTLILTHAARRDVLTGLPLRHGLEHDFGQLKKEAARAGMRLYVVMIDIDRFKRVNDTWGHPVGDTVLRHLADTLRRCVRGNEPLYRFGGEEFLVLAQCRTVEAAAQTAERIVSAVRAAPAPLPDGSMLPLTVTAGLAEAADGETLTAVVERADAALYQGKQAGRDRWVIAGH